LDVEQFRRAILNLALNAVQASPAKEEVRIEIHGFSRPELMVCLYQRGFSDLKPAETEGNWAVILVLDHGHGIQPENIKKLFTPFFTTKTEGFGLGLSITQKIVEALGGSIAAANRPEGGAVFLVILPALDKKKGERL
jgi:signal transduction histidine kinase